MVIAAIGAFLFLRGDGNATVASSFNDDPNAEARIDGESNGGPGQAEESDEDTDATAAPFFGDPMRPDSVAVDASSVWVSDAACGVVVKIDKGSEEVVGSVSVNGSASGVAVTAGSVWVGTRDQGTVARIDSDRLTVGASASVPGFALGLTAEGNDVWASDALFGAVHRIDAARGQVVETVNVGSDPHHIAVGASTVWVTNQADDTVSIIPRGRGGVPFEVPVGSSPLHVELGAGSAWVTDSSDGTVTRLNDTSGELEAVIEVGSWPHALAFANGVVWVGTESGTFWRIDPATNESTRVEDADFGSIDAAVDGNDIWIADATGGSVIRFDAATGTVGSVVDLSEFGDCATFLDEGFDPQPERPDYSL